MLKLALNQTMHILKKYKEITLLNNEKKLLIYSINVSLSVLKFHTV